MTAAVAAGPAAIYGAYHYTGPEALRGGFEHYGTLLQDGPTNRQLLDTPLQTPVVPQDGEESGRCGQEGRHLVAFH